MQKSVHFSIDLFNVKQYKNALVSSFVHYAQWIMQTAWTWLKFSSDLICIWKIYSSSNRKKWFIKKTFFRTYININFKTTHTLFQSHQRLQWGNLFFIYIYIYQKWTSSVMQTHWNKLIFILFTGNLYQLSTFDIKLCL